MLSDHSAHTGLPKRFADSNLRFGLRRAVRKTSVELPEKSMHEGASGRPIDSDGSEVAIAEPAIERGLLDDRQQMVVASQVPAQVQRCPGA